MLLRQRDDQRLGPYSTRVAVGQLRRTSQENKVETVCAKLHHRIAGRAFRHLNVEARMTFTIPADQLGKEAARNQGVDADAKAAAFPRCRHAGRLYSMVELIHADGDVLDEAATGLCQPDPSRMALEQENTKIFLQSLHAGADARNADTQRVGSMAEIEIFGDRERLDQRGERNARPQQGRPSPLTVDHGC